MLNLDFWFMFFGFLLMVATAPAVVSPEFLKNIFKKIFKDENHLRVVSVWYLSAGPLALYSGWVSGNYFAANFISLVGLLFILQGIGLFFATEWYQNNLLKRILKFSDNAYRLGGLANFIFGAALFYYGVIWV
jgi:uncharacterized protein YjeT (DUF2065 family)